MNQRAFFHLDSYENRLNYFEKCMHEVFKIKNLESIGMQQFLACDEFHHWEKYKNIISSFAKKFPMVRTVVYTL